MLCQVVSLNYFYLVIILRLKILGLQGATNINLVTAATAKMSTADAAAALVKTNLTKVQQMQILMDRGLTKEEAEAALATAAHTTSSIAATGATGALTTATISLKTAFKGLWATLKANPIILVVTVIASLIAGIQKLIDLQEEQAEKAKEQAQASKQNAENLKQEKEQLSELIKRYKEIASSDNLDVSAREEIAEIQTNITKLVGEQANSLDLVNGKLDEELQKLYKIQGVINGDTTASYEQAYLDAKNATSKYDSKNANWMVDYLGIHSSENEITFDIYTGLNDKSNHSEMEIIDKVWKEKGYGRAYSDYISGWLYEDNYDVLEFDPNLTVAQRIEALDSAIEALKNDPNFDYTNSDLWTKLVTIRDELAGSNGLFTQQANAAFDLLENLTETAIGDGIDVSTVDELNEYKKEMFDKIISNDVLQQAMNDGALSTDSVSAYINNYFTTLDKYDEFFKSQTTQADRLANTFGSFNDTIKTVKAAIDELNSSGQVSAETYNQVIALNEDYADLFTFTNGKIEIAANEVDNLVENLIEEYGATLVANGATEEEIALMVSLAKTLKVVSKEFDDLKDKYENDLDGLDHLSNTYENAIDELEAKGLKRTATYYEKLKAVEESKISILQDELFALTQEFQNAITSGKVEDGSEEWYKMNAEINKVKESIQKSQIAVLEFANEIRKIDWEYFDFQQRLNSNITNESDFLLDLLGDKAMVDESGKLTEYGNASMGLHGVNYNIYLHQAKQYADEIANIEKELASDPYNQDLIDRKEELLGLQRDSVLAAEEEKQAMIDLATQGIEAELDALQDLIDKYAEALDSAKDLYDYQNKVSDATEEISKLQKMIIAYENDTSEEMKAEIQKLKVDLQEAQKELQETEYDQFISDQKKLLDNLYLEYETMLNRRLDNIGVLINSQITSINTNASAIKETLETVTSEVGTTLSTEMDEIWTVTDELKEVVTNADSILNESVDGLEGTLGNVSGSLTGISGTATTISGTLSRIETLVGNLKLNGGGNSTITANPDNSGGATNPPPTSATELPTNPSTPSTSTPAPAVKNPTVEETIAEKIVKFGDASGRGMNAGKSGDNGVITWNGKEYNVQNSGTAYDSSTPLYKAAVNVLGFSDRQIFGYNGKVYGYLDSHIQELEGRALSKKGYNNFVAAMQANYPAYKEGGIVDHTGLAWVDGTKTKPEAFLDAEDTKNVSNLTSMLSKLAPDDIYVSKPYNMQIEPVYHDNQSIKDIKNRVMSQIENNVINVEQNIKVENNIEIDHVQDYNDFVTKLQEDGKFEKMIQTMTIGRINGGNALDKYKYRWK